MIKNYTIYLKRKIDFEIKSSFSIHEGSFSSVLPLKSIPKKKVFFPFLVYNFECARDVKNNILLDIPLNTRESGKS